MQGRQPPRQTAKGQRPGLETGLGRIRPRRLLSRSGKALEKLDKANDGHARSQARVEKVNSEAERLTLILQGHFQV